MADQIDSTDPTHIDTSWDGLPVARITVFADPDGQCFDVSDTGNAPASKVAQVVAGRYQQQKWSVCYINESGEEPMTTALELVGLGWTDARYWPRRGVYMWAADPSGNIAAGRWVPPVAPILVQDRYRGTYDLSRVNGPWPGRVAGYIDGQQSVWPPAAWSRFATIPDMGTPKEQLDRMEISIDGKVIVGAATDNGNLLCFTLGANGWDVIDVTDQATATAHQNNPADTRVYKVN